MRPVRVAVIGLGAVAQSVHLPIVQRNRADVDLVALCEVSPSRLATIGRRYGVPSAGWFATAQDLASAILQGRVSVDAAIVATTGNHADDALTLIRAGVRVLAEKPLAYSFADLDNLEAGLAELGRDPDAWLRVGYMKEYDPAVAAARVLLTDVTPREVSVEVLHPADGTQLKFARLEAPATDVDPALLAGNHHRLQRSISAAVGSDDTPLRKLYSDVVLGSIIHDIALTRHLGLALTDVAHATHWGPEFPGSVIGSGATAGGVPFSLRWHFIKDFPAYRELVTVHHERGSVELEFTTPYILNAPTILRTCSGGGDLRSTACEEVWPQEEAFEREFRALLDMTRDSGQAGSSIDAARQDLASAQTLWRACAMSSGTAIDPACEASEPHHRATVSDGRNSGTS
ncbi:MAG: Gfo/Idh/MocA family oxidoreductase [Arachnia sp.]